MLKFLRKYQLILLAGAGSVLMVIFLLEPVMQGLGPNPANRQVATIGASNEKVIARDLSLATFDLRVAETLIDRRLAAFGQPGLLAMIGVESQTQEAHWYLLVREAEQAGLVGMAADGKLFADKLASELSNALITATIQQEQRVLDADERQEIADTIAEGYDKDITQLASQIRAPVEEVYKALGRIAGVQRLVRLYQQGPKISDVRLREAAVEVGSAAFVDAIIIGPEAVNTEIPEPTDEQLTAFMNKYGDVEPGDREASPLGFGFRQPPTVKIGYIYLSPQVIAPTIEVDRVEVSKRWRRDNPGAPQSDFESAREEVERVLRQETTTEVIDTADEAIRAELFTYLRQFPDEGPYKALPDDWREKFPKLGDVANKAVEAVKERHGIDIPRPFVNVREESFLAPINLRVMPGLANATYRIGNTVIPVIEVAQHLRETDPATLLEAQVGVPIIDPIATDPQGNKIYLTVMQYRPAGPPESINSVRRNLRDAWRFQFAYDKLTAELPTYERVAREGGLDALLAMFDRPGAENPIAGNLARDVFINASFAAITVPENGTTLDNRLRQSATFREATREEARKLDPLAPVDSTPASESTIGIELPDQRAVAVAQIRAYRPVTRELIRQQGEQLAGAERIKPSVDARRDIENTWPFSYRALAERHNFIRSRDEEQG